MTDLTQPMPVEPAITDNDPATGAPDLPSNTGNDTITAESSGESQPDAVASQEAPAATSNEAYWEALLADDEAVSPEATAPEVGEDTATPEAGEDTETPEAGEGASTPDAGEDVGEDAGKPNEGEDAEASEASEYVYGAASEAGEVHVAQEAGQIYEIEDEPSQSTIPPLVIRGLETAPTPAPETFALETYAANTPSPNAIAIRPVEFVSESEPIIMSSDRLPARASAKPSADENENAEDAEIIEIVDEASSTALATVPPSEPAVAPAASEAPAAEASEAAAPHPADHALAQMAGQINRLAEQQNQLAHSQPHGGGVATNTTAHADGFSAAAGAAGALIGGALGVIPTALKAAKSTWDATQARGGKTVTPEHSNPAPHTNPDPVSAGAAPIHVNIRRPIPQEETVLEETTPSTTQSPGAQKAPEAPKAPETQAAQFEIVDEDPSGTTIQINKAATPETRLEQAREFADKVMNVTADFHECKERLYEQDSQGKFTNPNMQAYHDAKEIRDETHARYKNDDSEEARRILQRADENFTIAEDTLHEDPDYIATKESCERLGELTKNPDMTNAHLDTLREEADKMPADRPLHKPEMADAVEGALKKAQGGIEKFGEIAKEAAEIAKRLKEIIERIINIIRKFCGKDVGNSADNAATAQAPARESTASMEM